jgi:spoIIIJ-associated protein
MSFFSKIFGGKKSESLTVDQLIQDTLAGLLDAGKFDLSYDMTRETDELVRIDLTGNDEDLLKSKDGQVLESIQLFLKRVCQHRFPEDNSEIILDCGGFREEANQALVDLAEKLKSVALEKGRTVYFRALPPKDRKVIHQYLANDSRVKSRSVGDGLYKKIKIYPAKNNSTSGDEEVQPTNA